MLRIFLAFTLGVVVVGPSEVAAQAMSREFYGYELDDYIDPETVSPAEALALVQSDSAQGFNAWMLLHHVGRSGDTTFAAPIKQLVDEFAQGQRPDLLGFNALYALRLLGAPQSYFLDQAFRHAESTMLSSYAINILAQDPDSTTLDTLETLRDVRNGQVHGALNLYQSAIYVENTYQALPTPEGRVDYLISRVSIGRGITDWGFEAGRPYSGHEAITVWARIKLRELHAEHPSVVEQAIAALPPERQRLKTLAQAVVDAPEGELPPPFPDSTPPACPATLALVDFLSYPSYALYVDLYNTSTTEAVPLAGCTVAFFYFNHQTEERGAAYRIYQPDTTLAPGDTLRVGPAGPIDPNRPPGEPQIVSTRSTTSTTRASTTSLTSMRPSSRATARTTTGGSTRAAQRRPPATMAGKNRRAPSFGLVSSPCLHPTTATIMRVRSFLSLLALLALIGAHPVYSQQVPEQRVEDYVMTYPGDLFDAIRARYKPLDQMVADPEPHLAYIRSQLVYPDDDDLLEYGQVGYRLNRLVALAAYITRRADLSAYVPEVQQGFLEALPAYIALKDMFYEAAEGDEDSTTVATIRKAWGGAGNHVRLTLGLLADIEDASMADTVAALVSEEAYGVRASMDQYLAAVDSMPPCLESLAILDVHVAPDTAEVLDVVNTSSTDAADLGYCVLGFFDAEDAYKIYDDAYPPALVPGDTLRFGSIGVSRADLTLPEAMLQNGPGTIAIIDRPYLVEGTPLEEVSTPFPGDVITLITYTGDTALTDLYHRDPEVLETYCTVYADRMAPGTPAADVCAAITPPPPPADDCGQIPAEADVAFETNEVWATGYNAQIQLTNTGAEAIRGWTLAFTLPAPITNLWNGQLTGSAPQYTIIDAGHNSVIPPGQSASFGFQVQADTVVAPTDYALNEIDCAAQAPSVDVTFQTTEVWATGYNAQIQLTNTGEEALRGWRLAFELDAPIASLWNGQLSGSRPVYTVTDAGHNGLLAPGETVTVGFQAQSDTVVEPSDYDVAFWAIGP
ncbi:MAG: hypothetical protein GVY12_00655 [Bacteroidetes bacterium]|nr:hypothetical protein [Bacteroidota bacterium]